MAWLTNYNYRKAIDIHHTDDAAQSNYQMKLVINRTTGSDSAGTVYVSDKCATDYDDIRFTKSDGTTLLDYWIESFDANTATVWVEFDSIPAHPNDGSFYLYYGYASATAVSNGPNTFLFHDHFDVDLSKWSGDTASASIASSICILTSTGAVKYIYTGDYANNIAMRTRANITGLDYYELGLTDNGDNKIKIQHNSEQTNHSIWYTADAVDWTIISNQTIGFGAYHIYDFCRVLTGTDTVRVFMDNAQVGSDATAYVPLVGLRACFTVDETAGNILSDWVLIRNYTTNEPTWGTWGSEEVASSYIAFPRYFRGISLPSRGATIDNLLSIKHRPPIVVGHPHVSVYPHILPH